MAALQRTSSCLSLKGLDQGRHDLGRVSLSLRQEANRDDPFSFPLVPKLRLGTHFPKLRFANASPPIGSPGVLAGLKLQACTLLLGVATIPLRRPHLYPTGQNGQTNR